MQISNQHRFLAVTIFHRVKSAIKGLAILLLLLILTILIIIYTINLKRINKMLLLHKMFNFNKSNNSKLLVPRKVEDIAIILKELITIGQEALLLHSRLNNKVIILSSSYIWSTRLKYLMMMIIQLLPCQLKKEISQHKSDKQRDKTVCNSSEPKIWHILDKIVHKIKEWKEEKEQNKKTFKRNMKIFLIWKEWQDFCLELLKIILFKSRTNLILHLLLILNKIKSLTITTLVLHLLKKLLKWIIMKDCLLLVVKVRQDTQTAIYFQIGKTKVMWAIHNKWKNNLLLLKSFRFNINQLKVQAMLRELFFIQKC